MHTSFVLVAVALLAYAPLHARAMPVAAADAECAVSDIDNATVPARACQHGCCRHGVCGSADECGRADDKMMAMIIAAVAVALVVVVAGAACCVSDWGREVRRYMYQRFGWCAPSQRRWRMQQHQVDVKKNSIVPMVTTDGYTRRATPGDGPAGSDLKPWDTKRGGDAASPPLPLAHEAFEGTCFVVVGGSVETPGDPGTWDTCESIALDDHSTGSDDRVVVERAGPGSAHKVCGWAP